MLWFPAVNLDRFANSTIIPSRSRYQLRKFVIGQHDTAPMQWRQVLIEAQDLAYKIRLAEIDIQKKSIEIQRLSASGDPIDALEAEERQLSIALTERTLKGAHMELMWLQEIADEIGAYTFEEIEADQPNYWALRLDRQASLDKLAVAEGISPGNLQALLDAGLIGKVENTAIASEH